MTARIIKYVAYLYPGIMVTEESTKEVAVRSTQTQITEAPEGAFGFFYFDVIATDVSVDGELYETRSSRNHISPTYFIDAELLDMEAVKALEGDHDRLLRNMENSDIGSVIRTRRGNFMSPTEYPDYSIVRS